MKSDDPKRFVTYGRWLASHGDIRVIVPSGEYCLVPEELADQFQDGDWVRAEYDFSHSAPIAVHVMAHIPHHSARGNSEVRASRFGDDATAWAFCMIETLSDT